MTDHPATDDCPDEECGECAERDCPHDEPLHYHHDGCPACDAPSALEYHRATSAD